MEDLNVGRGLSRCPTTLRPPNLSLLHYNTRIHLRPCLYNTHIQHTDLGEVLEPRLPGQRLVQLPQARRLPLGDFQFSLVDGGVVIWRGVCVASVYVPSTYLSQPRGRAHTYTHLEGLGQVGGVELAGPDLRPVNVLLPALAENAKTKGRRGIYTYFCGGFE